MTIEPFISDAVINNLASVLKALPPELRIPRIHPDGEGGVQLDWELAFVILDEKYIHVVKNPATPNAKYLEDVPYDGGAIPENVMLLLLEAHEKC